MAKVLWIVVFIQKEIVEMSVKDSALCYGRGLIVLAWKLANNYRQPLFTMISFNSEMFKSVLWIIIISQNAFP